jgi:hypothetical protein
MNLSNFLIARVSFRFRAFDDEFSPSLLFFSLASISSRRLLKPPPLFFLLRGEVTNAVVADVIFFSPCLRARASLLETFVSVSKCVVKEKIYKKDIQRTPSRTAQNRSVVAATALFRAFFFFFFFLLFLLLLRSLFDALSDGQWCAFPSRWFGSLRKACFAEETNT